MRRGLLAVVAALLVLTGLPVRAQKPADVLDWKAPTTLNTYLLQAMHRQYTPRAAELAAAVASAAGTVIYQDSVRARFRRVLGPLPLRTPLRAQVTGQVPRPELGLRIEKVVYESTPGHHVTANVYVPAGPGRRPAVLLFCGHEPEAKATASYQKTALLFATNGFVVLVIDPISQGERLQMTDAKGQGLARGGTTEHTLLNAGATLVGTSVAAEELWDNVRGLDYLLTRPDVDAARIGCLGNSGGATQAAYFMGLDERVKVAALCSYVASGERTLELTGPADGCVQLPGAGQARLDVADWLILFAPKPLLVLAGRYDFVDYTSIEAAYAESRQAYAALGKSEQMSLFTYDDGHGISQPKREAAVEWFRRWLCNDPRPVHEPTLHTLPAGQLQCTSTGQVNTAYRAEASLAGQHQARAQELARRRPALTGAALAAAVHQQLGLPKPAANMPVTAETRDTLHQNGMLWYRLILRRPGEPPLPVLLLLPPGSERCAGITLWLPDQGKSAYVDSLAFWQACQRQRTAVLLADLRGFGETADPSVYNDPKYYNAEYRPAILSLHIGRPLLAQRVLDVHTLLAWIETDDRLRGAPLVVQARGRAAAVALHAATLFPAIHRLVLTQMPVSLAQTLLQPTRREAYSSALPGVLSRYDLPDLQRALGSRLVLTGQ